MRHSLVKRTGILFLFAWIIIGLFGCTPRDPDPGVTVAAAEEHRDAGDLDEAIELLATHRERDPGSPAILETIAFMYAERGDMTEAAFAFLERYEAVPDEPEYLLYAARSLRTDGDTRGAAGLYRRYLEVEPENRSIWQTLARLEEEAGRFNQAISAYTRVYRMREEPEVAARIGALFHGIRNPAQAENWYQTAARADPPPRRALTGAFQLHMEQGRFRNAETALRALRVHYPEALEEPALARNEESLMTWLEQQAETVRLVAALAASDRSAAEQDREPEPVDAPAEHEAPGEPSVAHADPEPRADPAPETPHRTETESAPPVARQPDPSSELEQDAWRARQKREAGDLPGAIAGYREILTRDDRDPALWHELSEAYFSTAQFEWAEATALEAVRRDPDSVRYTLQYLRSAQRTMSPEQLMNELIRANRRFPHSPDIILAAARGYRNIARNHRNARILYERFLDLAPDHPQRAAAERELRSL